MRNLTEQVAALPGWIDHEWQRLGHWRRRRAERRDRLRTIALVSELSDDVRKDIGWRFDVE